MNIAIAGLGLIGGSFAKAISARTDHRVTGCDRNADTLRQALADGAIQDTAEDDFSGADLILVALFPADAVEFIRQKMPTFRPGAVLIDLCGVKQFICDSVAPLVEGTGVSFIGGHPMAGREQFGYESSLETLYDGASMILTPIPSTPKPALELAETFFLSLGFGHIEITTPDRHDEMIAYTSQLAHVVSSAYIQSPVARDYQGFSAGSFKDLTRVARLNETMWTELFLHNPRHLTDQIQVIIENLEQFRDVIRAGDRETLTDILRRGRELKEQLQ